MACDMATRLLFVLPHVLSASPDERVGTPSQTSTPFVEPVARCGRGQSHFAGMGRLRGLYDETVFSAHQVKFGASLTRHLMLLDGGIRARTL